MLSLNTVTIVAVLVRMQYVKNNNYNLYVTCEQVNYDYIRNQ